MTIFYPDIASYQAGIDLFGALAVVAKATEGTGYVNPAFAAFRTEAGKSGAFFCAYHFLHAGNPAGQAAEAFRVAGKTPLMIDCEPSGTSRPGMGDVTGFTDAYRKLGGVVWTVYLPKWYWSQAPFSSVSLQPLITRGLRLVSSDYSRVYTDTAGTGGWAAYGGMTPVSWQYTDNVPFNGMKIDFNAFRGSGGDDVAQTVAEFKSVFSTGKLPVVVPAAAKQSHPHEWAWVSDGSKSLATLAAGRKGWAGETLTPYRVLVVCAKHGSITGGFGPYVNRAGVKDGICWAEPVPAGVVVWFPAGW